MYTILWKFSLNESIYYSIPRHELSGTAIGLPISWGGARGVNGAAYMAVPWNVWDILLLYRKGGVYDEFTVYE